MKSRKNLLKKSRLYLILNRSSVNNGSLEKIASHLSGSGIGIIQLRDKISPKAEVIKAAIKLAKILKGSGMLFIVNDYPDAALLSGADGLHLGQGDLSLSMARSLLGKNKIIGISCHNLSQALQAQRDGADYIGMGPVYSTPTKPEYAPVGLEVLRQCRTRIKIPYFAIGNINERNLKKIISAGATRIAVCRAVLKARVPKQAAQQLFEALK